MLPATATPYLPAKWQTGPEPSVPSRIRVIRWTLLIPGTRGIRGAQETQENPEGLGCPEVRGLLETLGRLAGQRLRELPKY